MTQRAQAGVLGVMRQLLALLTLATTFACARDSAGPRAGPLVLDVDVNRAVIGVGDTATVTVRLRNRGPFPVSFTTGGCMVLPYISAEPSGEIVYPTGGKWVCTLELRRMTLEAGGEETLQFRVRGAADSGSGRDATLPRGTYLVQATFWSQEFRLRAEPVALTVE